MIVPAAEIVQVSASILDSSGKTVYFKDLTKLGKGSRDLWSYYWTWNASSLVMGENQSAVLDADQGSVPALLYLNNSSPPVQVSIKFDPLGQIDSIVDNNVLYYVSREGYKLVNSSLSYEEMLSNKPHESKSSRFSPTAAVSGFTIS